MRIIAASRGGDPRREGDPLCSPSRRSPNSVSRTASTSSSLTSSIARWDRTRLSRSSWRTLAPGSSWRVFPQPPSTSAGRASTAHHCSSRARNEEVTWSIGDRGTASPKAPISTRRRPTGQPRYPPSNDFGATGTNASYAAPTSVSWWSCGGSSTSSRSDPSRRPTRDRTVRLAAALAALQPRSTTEPAPGPPPGRRGSRRAHRARRRSGRMGADPGLRPAGADLAPGRADRRRSSDAFNAPRPARVVGGAPMTSIEAQAARTWKAADGSRDMRGCRGEIA